MAMMEQQEWLVGAPGSFYVAERLQKVGPVKTVEEMQTQHGLRHPLCPALLGMLDTLGVSRAAAHQQVLNKAKLALLARIHGLPSADDDRKVVATLEGLLSASFPYLGVAELADVSGSRTPCWTPPPPPREATRPPTARVSRPAPPRPLPSCPAPRLAARPPPAARRCP
jgi:hypothetical protein